MEEIAYAVRLGMDVVVTDHHQPREKLPACTAVVNPHRKDQQGGFRDLAGVGVAFKLVCAMEADSSGEMLEYYSDLAALGTIADVVPLKAENRLYWSAMDWKVCSIRRMRGWRRCFRLAD